MTDYLFIVYLIILFIVILFIYINRNSRDTFEDYTNRDNQNNLGKMFNELDEWEKKCNAIEEKQQIKNDIDKIKQNEVAFNQLEELDKKIYELKEIVKDLTIEKKRRDGINEKCQENAQIKLNQNYDLVNDLNKKGLVNKQNIDLDFNISDNLNLSNLNNENNRSKNKKKCDIENKDKFNLDEVNLQDKCYRCDGDKLKKNYQYLNKDFN